MCVFVCVCVCVCICVFVIFECVCVHVTFHMRKAMTEFKEKRHRLCAVYNELFAHALTLGINRSGQQRTGLSGFIRRTVNY